MKIPDYAESNKKYGQVFGEMVRPGNSSILFNSVFHIDATTAITSVTFFPDTGTFTGGTYIVYGVN
jgi:hypothetical protein